MQQPKLKEYRTRRNFKSLTNLTRALVSDFFTNFREIEIWSVTVSEDVYPVLVLKSLLEV